MVPFLIAVVFYVLFPMVGAWRSRRNWARFRDSAFTALRSPEVDFSLLQPGADLAGGTYRLTGTLEAFEGGQRLWIGNPKVSVAVSLRGAPVYFLDEPASPLGLGAEPPRKAEASSLGALPEGTQFLVSGALTRDSRGQVHFASVPDRRLLVLAFEGSGETVLARAVFAGRPSVDHWNSWTPWALGLGFLFLLTLAYADLRTGGARQQGLDALALALLPATFFLPPGILFFFGFARFWARGRDLRARADWHRIDSTLVPDHRATGLGHETVAHVLLLSGAAANVLLLQVVLNLVLP